MIWREAHTTRLRSSDHAGIVALDASCSDTHDHDCLPDLRNTRQYPHALAFTALTIFCAASSRSLAEITLSPDSLMIFLPCSTLVPSRRTTRGTARPTSLTAATTPSAIT